MPNRELTRVAEVDRPGEVVRRVHHLEQTVDQIVNVAERSRLRAVAVDRDVLADDRLADEVAHDAPIKRVHARAVGVEDSHDANVDVVLPAVIEHERLGSALALVVTGAGADGVDVAAIRLRLRVDGRIAVHFTRGGVEHLRSNALGQPQHVDRPHHRSLDRLDRVVLVVARGSGTREVVDLVHLEEQRLDHIVADQLEIAVVQQVLDVGFL